MAAGHVIAVALIALLVGAVLNAPALSAAADSRPFGWRRTVAIVAVAPVKGISSLLRLDRPHRALAQAAAEARGEQTAVSSAGDPLPPPPAAPETGTEDDVAAAPGAVSPTSAPREPEPTSRRISDKRPLRLWVGGDSLASEFGPALAEAVTRTRRAEAEVDFRYSTGLTRPDFFDWPAQLDSIVEDQNPDVFVVVFGANDAQNLSVGGKVIAFGTPEWIDTYSARVGALMTSLTGDGQSLYWIGQPIMQSTSFDARMKLLNTIYAEQAAEHGDAVTYIDTRELFSLRGAYAPYLDDADGQRTLMRQQDGVHLTRAGGERLADVVFDKIGERWPLRGSD